MVEEKNKRRSVLYYVFQKNIENNPMPKESQERILSFIRSHLEMMKEQQNSS